MKDQNENELKAKEFRELLYTLKKFRDEGNEFDLNALLDDPKGKKLIPAPRLEISLLPVLQHSLEHQARTAQK